MEEFQQPEPENTELETQLKYFSLYKIAPIIFTIAAFILFFIASIVTATIIAITTEATWGILIGCGLFIGGIVISAATYFLTKMHFCHRLLHIYYLQKITNEENRILKDTIENPPEKEN